MTRRLVLSYVTIAILVIAILEIPLGIVFARSERRNLVAELKHDALSLGAISEETLVGNANDDLQKLVRDYQSDTDGRVIITDVRGRLVADSSVERPTPRNYGTRREIIAALAGREVDGTRRSETLDTNLLFVAVPVTSSGDVVGTVRITYTPTDVDARVRRGWFALGVVGVIILAATTGVSIFIARSVTQPLRELEHAATHLSEGDLAARAKVTTGPGEIVALAATFDTMAARLESLVHAQEEFVADASHQLRTPLQALRLRLENAEAVARSSAARDELQAAQREVARLGQLVEGLLALARAERAAPTPRSIDVTQIIDERHGAWTAMANERGVELTTKARHPVLAMATSAHLEQALDNLIANALFVAPPDSEVTLSARRSDGWVEVHVTDAGPGMAAEQRERAGDRFWRSPDASYAGSGLGLAIVRRLVSLDGGELHLRDAEGAGLDAVVKLRPSTR